MLLIKKKTNEHVYDKYKSGGKILSKNKLNVRVLVLKHCTYIIMRHVHAPIVNGVPVVTVEPVHSISMYTYY
jgi:adenylyl- and sulfurtransferase ThiI